MSVLVGILQSAIAIGTVLLFGAVGEIITEKAGNLNLGIPGVMYVGAISGVIGAFFYQESPLKMNPICGILIPLICCIIGSLFASLIYSFLTVTLRANQNVTGLALTTFGVGCGNFFGGSLIQLTKSETPNIILNRFADYYRAHIEAMEENPIGRILFSHGFMVYLAVIIAVAATLILKRTRVGLQLRAVGESPATADAAGINVTKYKYFAICIGGAIAGLGGLYYVMDYQSGIWSSGTFGDLGWLAIALVIFSTWKPAVAIGGSYLFGALYVLNSKINAPTMYQPLIQMLPYVVTIVVLILISVRRKRETQPPASLGLNYFREER